MPTPTLPQSSLDACARSEGQPQGMASLCAGQNSGPPSAPSRRDLAEFDTARSRRSMRPNGRLAVGKFGSQTTGSGRLRVPSAEAQSTAVSIDPTIACRYAEHFGAVANRRISTHHTVFRSCEPIPRAGNGGLPQSIPSDGCFPSRIRACDIQVRIDKLGADHEAFTSSTMLINI